MRISDWSSDVCATDLRLDLGPIAFGRDDHAARPLHRLADEGSAILGPDLENLVLDRLNAGIAKLLFAHPLPFAIGIGLADMLDAGDRQVALRVHRLHAAERDPRDGRAMRSEEHTSELQSLMRISYA